MFKKIKFIKNFLLFVIILVLGANLLLDFSFVTNQLGKDFREFAYKYVVPFKNTGNLEKKIEELVNLNSQNLAATIQVDEKNINDLEENIKKINKEKIFKDIKKTEIYKKVIETFSDAELVDVKFKEDQND